MARITSVPDEYYQGFVKLFSLESLAFEMLVNALKRAEPTLGTMKLANNLGPIENLEPETITDILLSVSSLNNYREEIDASVEDTVGDVNFIITTREKDSLFSRPERQESFKKRLTALLQNEQVYCSSKALGLTNNYDKVYYSAKVISDIRPIFGTNTADKPKASLVTHTLKIHFAHFKDDEWVHEDTYVTMDINDIRRLKEVLSRAERKERTLAGIIKEAGMKNLSPAEEE